MVGGRLYLGLQQQVPQPERKRALLLKDHGRRNDRSFYGSVNGLDWIAYGTEATNTGVTPTKPGIVLYNNGGGNSGVAIMQIYHFLVTGSILPQFGA